MIPIDRQWLQAHENIFQGAAVCDAKARQSTTLYQQMEGILMAESKESAMSKICLRLGLVARVQQLHCKYINFHVFTYTVGA
jgi:hypothetical protein